MATVNLRVTREKMIEVVQAVKDRQVAAFEKAQATYDARFAKWAENVAKALVAADPDKLHETTHYVNHREHRGVLVPVSTRKPTKPVLNTAAADRDLALLRASAQDSILVTDSSRWHSYFAA